MATSDTTMDIRCACGGTLHEVTLHNFDFTAFAGIAVTLAEAPGYRCSACGKETLGGEVINLVLRELAPRVIQMPKRLPGDHARFLRKHMRLSQKALAERMGCARETVAKWEIGETVISPQHDMQLRSIATAHLLRAQATISRAEVARVLECVREEEPLKTPPPFIIDSLLRELRAEQTWH